MHPSLADCFTFQTLARTPVKVDPVPVVQGKKLTEDLQCASCHRPGFKGINAFHRLARRKKP